MECRFLRSTSLPLSLSFRYPPPWSPAPKPPGELAPGPGPALFPGSARRWMEAETQGQGRGGRGPGAPLCAQGRLSSTRRRRRRRPLPRPPACARAGDLSVRGELHFRTSENSCQWTPLSHPPRARGGPARLGWHSFPGVGPRSWGRLGIPSPPAAYALEGPAALINPPWPGPAESHSSLDPGEARLEGASKSSLVPFMSIPGQKPCPKVVFFGVLFCFCGGGEAVCFSRGNSWGWDFKAPRNKSVFPIV